jgi:hypothetical protein
MLYFADIDFGTVIAYILAKKKEKHCGTVECTSASEGEKYGKSFRN